MYKDIIRKHRPRGWRIAWLTNRHKFCTTCWDCRTIASHKPTDVDSLWTLLHEFGHVNLGHGRDHAIYEHAQCEYEAEKYAIDALRAEGISIARSHLNAAKGYVDQCIRLYPDIQQTEEVLKFAYGRNWREHQ